MESCFSLLFLMITFLYRSWRAAVPGICILCCRSCCCNCCSCSYCRVIITSTSGTCLYGSISTRHDLCTSSDDRVTYKSVKIGIRLSVNDNR